MSSAERWRSVVAALLSGGCTIFVLWQLGPAFNQRPSLALAENSTQFHEFEIETRREAQFSDDFITRYFEFPVTFLVSVSIADSAHNSSGQTVVPGVPPESPGVHGSHLPAIAIRYDRLVLLLGSVAMTILAVWILFPRDRTTDEAVTSGDAARASVAASGAQESSVPVSDSMSATHVLQNQVHAADRRTEALFSRATLLLLGGIVMAFFGVATFSYMLPDASKQDRNIDVWVYLKTVIRPSGVLIFLEGIAWFLLRQYRSLIEDYKWFYRVYIRRANNLAALRVLDKPEVSSGDLLLAQSILQEDLSGKLKSGETLESVQRLEIAEDGPVKEILAGLQLIMENARQRIAPSQRGKKSGKVGDTHRSAVE